MILGGKPCALGDPSIQTALRVMRENAGLDDRSSDTASARTAGLDAPAVGAAGGVLQRLLNAADALDPMA